MFRGGDLGYLPWYRKPDGAGATVAVRRREEIEEYEEGRPKWFAGDKPKGLWNEAHFRNITFLYNHNCKNCFMSYTHIYFSCFNMRGFDFSVFCGSVVERPFYGKY